MPGPSSHRSTSWRRSRRSPLLAGQPCGCPEERSRKFREREEGRARAVEQAGKRARRERGARRWRSSAGERQGGAATTRRAQAHLERETLISQHLGVDAARVHVALALRSLDACGRGVQSGGEAGAGRSSSERRAAEARRRARPQE
jgi:hypothetical protein